MNPTGHSRFNLALRTPAWARVLAVLAAVLLIAAATSVRPAERAAAQAPSGAAEKAAAPAQPAAQPLKSESAAAPPSADSAEAMAARSGGPDAFGYTFDDYEVHPAHGIQFQDISGTGTVLAQSGMAVTPLTGGDLDDGFWDVIFPIPFKFYGTNRISQTLSISTNGFATFNSAGATNFVNVPIPDNSDPNDAVFPFWDDLASNSNAAGIDCSTDIDCGIYFQTVGSAPNRRFIIQWNEMPFLGGNADEGYVTFQVQFVENSGEIRFEYQNPEGCTATDCVRGFGDSATIGIESADPANAFTPFTGLQYSFDEPALQGKAGGVIPSIVFHPPDLEITKLCQPAETVLSNSPASSTAEIVLAGQQWICTVTVYNRGTGAIANVIVSDSFGAGLTLAAVAGAAVNPVPPVEGAATVDLNFGTIAGQGSASATLAFVVSPDFVAGTEFGKAPVCNSVMIVNPMVDVNTDGDDFDEDCDLAEDRADLKVSKFVEPFTSVRAGDIFTYTIFVDNLGPSVSRNVVISDTFLSSGNVQIQSCAFSVSQGGGSITQFTCTTGPLVSTQFGSDIGTFRTSALDPLSPTSQGRLRASFRLVANQDIDTTNTVRVTADTPDQDMSNNMAMVNLSVSSVSDVFITKDDAGANPDAGEVYTYTLQVGNNGPSRAENVVVTDVLPLELDIISITPSIVGPLVPDSTPTPGSCATTQSAAGNEVVTCNFGTLSSVITAPGTVQRQVVIVVRVKEGTPEGTNLFNEARVSSDEYDDDNSNNIAVAVTPVGQLSQFLILKDCTPDPATAGGVLHCTYIMTNNGPSTANNVTFTDTWLNGGEFVTLISANTQGHPGGNTCYQEDFAGSTQVRCSFGDVPVGRVIRLDLQFAVDPSTPDGTNLFNCASLSADSPLSIDLLSDSCETTLVEGVSDVTVTKTASEPSPVAGTEFNYTFKVTNNGPSTAFNVTLTDNFNAAGLVYVSGPAFCAEGPADFITCDLGDMAPGAMTTFDVTVLIPPDFECGADLLNVAIVTWTLTPGGVPTVDTTAAGVSLVPVDCVSDLKVTKVGKPDNVVDEDGMLTYTIVVDNFGPSFAPAAAIKDLIAASGQFDVEAVSSDRPATCNSLPDPIGGNPFVPSTDLADGTGQTGNLSNLYQLDCTLDDPLGILTADGPPNSGRWIIQIEVDGDEPGSINNIVSALSGALDPDQSNNMAMTEHEVVSSADLSISKTDLPDCAPGDEWPGNFCDMMGNGDTVVIAGATDDPDDPEGDSTFHYRIVVENNGPGDAHNVVVTDNLPKEVEVTRIRKEPDTGSCTTVQGTDFQQVVTCNLGTLADGDEQRIDIYVRVPADIADGTILWNEAWVSSDAADANNDDNRTRTRTDVIGVADLNITKEDDPDPAFTSGGTGSYTLVVTNNGPSVARNVSVEDALPTGIDGTSVDVVGVTDEVCSISPLPGSGTGREVVRCQLGDLDPGESRTIVIQFTVADDLVPADDANQCVSTRNIATVTSDTKDPDTDDNSATADQDVCATADLKITKTSEPEKVNAGEQKKYTITVENLGPSDATGVTVHDVLPDDAIYEVDTNPAMCTQPANLVGFRAVLNTANEVVSPAGPDTATGLATFVLDTTTNVLEYTIFVNNMTSAITAAHIHTGVVGVNGPPLVNLFTGAPPVFDGSHPLVGKLTLPPADAAAIAGNPAGFYVNVHTTANPAGEIRGQLAQTLNSPLECEIGTLAAGSSHSFDIWALINPNTMSGMSIINTALVFADNPPDNNLSNNAAQAKNLVLSRSDLRVVKFGKPDAAVRAGDILTYTIIVDNLGPSAAKGVALKDVLRASGYFDVVNLDSDRDLTCASNPNPISGIGTIEDPLIPDNANDVEIDCTLDTPLGVLDVGDFPNPGRWIVTLRVKADETQSINNVADVVSDSVDPDMTNNHAQVEHEITDIADVALDKVGPMMVTAGGEIVYTITVVNNGPSTAENVVVYDRLPPGIVVTNVTAEGGTCTTGTAGSPFDKLTCNLGLLGVGEDRVITITATVDPGLATGVILENDACVLSDHFDDDNSNNCDFTLTTVKSVADLAVTKISDRDDDGDATDDDEDPAVAGEPIEYTITVVNNGISDAANVVLVDTLPAGTTFLSATVTLGAGSCVGLPSGVVTCQLGVIEAGETVEIVIRALVNADYDCDDVPFLTNTVEVSSPSETDPATLPDNTFVLVTPVECNADLLIQKWSDPIKVYAGEQKRFTIKVTNLGPSNAYDVVIVDTLPAEVDYEINTGLCSFLNGVVTCDVGTLPPGGMFQFDIYARVDPATEPGTVITNCAMVFSESDPNDDNDEACSENLVLQKADLHIRKFGKPDGSVRAGDVLTYTVIVDNLGPSWADGVALKDVLQSSGTFDLIDIISDREASCRILPQGLVPVDANLAADAWPPDVPAPPAFGVNPNTGVPNIANRLEVDCTLAEPLEVLAADGPPNSGRWILTMRVRARQTQDINNVASVVSDAFDPDTSNNNAFVEHDIIDIADLSVEKTGPAMVVAGTPITYTITVTNNGPSDAENVVLLDRLPPGITVTSVTVDDGVSQCATGEAGNAADKLTCGLGLLRPGQSKVVTVGANVHADVSEGSKLENDVYVYSDFFDDDNSNNWDHLITMVGTEADLEVQKFGNPNPVKAGDITSFEITYRNIGPSVARDVILRDVLPEQFEFLSVEVVDGSPGSDSATCHPQTSDPALADSVDCELGDIAPGQGGTIILTVRVRSDTPAGEYCNTVFISSDTTDTDEFNNTAMWCLTISPMADLLVEKWSDPVKVAAGEQKRYTIKVTNLGPSDAVNVVITDTLPVEVDYEIDTGLCELYPNDLPDGGAGGADVVVCDFGTLTPGQMRTVDIYALVRPGTQPGTFITNCVDVDSDTPDGINDLNNTACSENFILQKADLKVTKFGKRDGAVRAADILTYTVIVDNLGPSWADNAAIKDVLQTSGKFELLSLHSDRAATCNILKAGTVPTTVNLAAEPWPVNGPLPVLPAVADIDQRVEVDCELDADLEVIEPDGPPNSGRWILTMRVRARQAQSVNNVATVTNVVPIEGDQFQGNLASDPDPSNNMAMVEHEITDVSDLRITKSATGEVFTSCVPGGAPIYTFPRDINGVLIPNNVATAGRSLKYTLVATNFGPSTAENVVIYDRLPPGVVLTDGTITDFTGVPSAGKFSSWCNTGTPGSPLDKLVCGVGTLEPVTDPAGLVIPPKSRVTIEFTVRLDPGLANNTILENDAYVASDVFDPVNKNWANNLTTVSTMADLAIDKTDTPDPVVAGELLRYQLMVTNFGPSVARDVTIYDTLPATVKYQFAIGAACIQDPVNPRAIQCSLGDMAPGEMRFVYLIVKVDPDSPSPISNTATVQSGNTDWAPLPLVSPMGKITPDLCPANNTDTESTTVIRRVDPFIMKTDLNDPVIAGKTATYLVMFGNNGPSTATNIVITDVLPDGFTFNRCEPLDPNDAATCTYNAATRTVTLTTLRLKNSIIWTNNTADVLNRLDPGENFSFLIVADVSPGYVLDGLSDAWGSRLAQPPNVPGVVGGVCESYGRASDYLHWAADKAILTQSPPPPNEIDTNPNNNSDDECTRVNSEADLKVVKTDIFSGGTADPGNAFLQCDPVQPGGMITYDLTVTNMGMSDAAPVVVTDWLPPEFVILDPAQITVTVNGGLGQVLDVRDDGRIRILVGRDSARAFVLPTLGRLNAMNSVVVRIQAMVADPFSSMPDPRFIDPISPFAGICGAVLLNTATVSTANGYYAPLRDLFEVPPVGAPPVGVGARGAGVFVVDPDTNQLFFWLGVINTTGNITAAHLHRATAMPFSYNNGPVVINLWLGAPPPFAAGTPVSGTTQLTQADIADIVAGKYYANVHTSSFPNGNLRGQLLPGTLDPNLTNNTDTETTTIECPAIAVRKTVSYDGTCPGASVPTVARNGAMVTFCIEVTNVGTTFLDTIVITDTLQTSMGVIQTTRVITHGKDIKLPVAPGETVLETIMFPPFTDFCGTLTNSVTVTGIPTNSGRTVFPCLSPVSASDSISIFVPCGGADYRLQLPALNTDECETWIQVQNVGSLPTKAIVVVWGEAGACPPQAAGPLKIECTGLLKPGSAWTYTTDNLPPGTRSAIVYSINGTDVVTDDRGNRVPFADLACDRLFNYIVGNHGEWLLFDYAYQTQGRYVLPPQWPNPQGIVFDFGAHPGQPIAVTVNRTCPDPVDPNRNVSAAYVGIGTYLEGAMDPVFGDFSYYAPLVFANKGGLNSWIWIHNSGLQCSSIEIWFKAQDNCMRPILGDVLAIAPGESAHFDPNTVVGPDWIGSAWIRASQPLGIVVDTMGPNHFTSYHGVPSDSYDDTKGTTFSIGSQVNYAPLIYSEYQGWDAAIQVQNLSGTTAAKVKVYFLDRSGDVITTIVDWICPRGSQTFFLPVISGMPGNWVGHARVESQEWWTPGTKPVDPPRIQSVVLLEKWSDPARSERREAVAYNALTEQVAYDWQIGKLQGGTMSGSAVLAVPLIAKGNRGITTELAITNLVAKPGFTDFAIIFYDQNGLLDFYCQKLGDRQVDYIDLATQGIIPQRFLGSAVISATFWEHDVFSPTGNFVRNLVGLGGVVVERIGGTQGGPDVPGDESKAFEMIPIFDLFRPQRVPTCTGQPPFNP
jgi:uncharacterized repeat protein (TIGR01451 family)